MWNADEYLKFSADRARPFADLMAQVSMAEVEINRRSRMRHRAPHARPRGTLAEGPRRGRR